MWVSKDVFDAGKGLVPSCNTIDRECMFLKRRLGRFICSKFAPTLVYRVQCYTEDDVRECNIPFCGVVRSKLRPSDLCLADVSLMTELSDLELSVLGGMLPSTESVKLSLVPVGILDAVKSLESKGLLFVYDDIIRLTFLGYKVWNYRVRIVDIEGLV